MKISVFLSFFFMSLAYSNETYGQNALISLHVKNQTVSEVLEKIEKQSNYFFFYNNREIDVNRPVFIDVENKQIRDVLDIIFSDSKIQYSVLENSIILSNREILTSTVEKAQGISITGTVIDTDGSPLPGVNVVIKGTMLGTVTDANGRYAINVPDENALLTFSFLGYLSQEIVVGNQRAVNVTLSEGVSELEEVVVVGYGTVKKADVTTSVSIVTSKNLENRPVLNALEAMAGQMPGVEIQQTGGNPGENRLLVRIRGANSLSGHSDPLYVVDGVPMSNALQAVSVNDIENVTVLKDVSATSIYGSRGSSGVVLISTKRGKAGVPVISVNSSVGVQQMARKIEVCNTKEYAELLVRAKNNSWVDRNPAVNRADDSNAVRYASQGSSLNYIIPDGQSNPWGTFKYNLLDPNDVAKMENIDWQDEIYSNAMITQNEVSISGGNDNTRYFFSGNYAHQDGILMHSNYERFNVRSKVDTKLRKNLTIGLQLMGNLGKGRLQQSGRNDNSFSAWSPTLSGLTFPSVYPIYNDNGEFADAERNPEIIGPNQNGFNPVELASQLYHHQKAHGWSAFSFLEWEIIPALKYKFTVNGSYSETKDNYFVPKGTHECGDTYTGTLSYSNRGYSRMYLIENLLTYDFTLAGKNNFSLLGGYTVENTVWESIYANAKDAATNYVHLVTGTPQSASTSATEHSLLSYLGRMMYNFDQRYMLTASVRWDGSSRFSPGHKWGFFPSASAGWNIKREAFMDNVQAVSDLKLRAGYGISGNNNIGNFDWQGNMGNNYYPLGETQIAVNGVPPGGRIQNDGLTWEKTKEFNIGFDLGLFRNRIILGADYYVRTSYDLLLSVPTPIYSGQKEFLMNMGKVENKGIELFISTRNVVKSDFTWNTDVNIFLNRNKVLALGPENAPIEPNYRQSGNPYFMTIVGEPVGSFWGFKVEGVFKNEADLANHMQIYQGVDRPGVDRPGQMYFKDANNDGKIDLTDKTVLGHNAPKFSGGMTNRFAYKNFGLDIQMTGNYGGKTLNLVYREIAKGNQGNRNMAKMMFKGWKSEAEPGNGKIPAVTSQARGYDNQSSSYWLLDNSYLRIRNVTLSYELPKELLNKIQISRLKVYVSAQNLFTFTNYFGYDPEANSSYNATRDNYSGSVQASGIDISTYPSTRIYTFGINLTL